MLATLIDGGTSVIEVLTKPSTLSLLDSVVSVQLLKNRLPGIQVLEISTSAVMTPAARDYIRECKVEVVRNQLNHAIIEPEALAERTSKSASASGSSAIARPQCLLVAGSTDWMPSMAKQLCSKQAKVCEVTPDDASALRTIANGLRAGHQAGVIVVQSPHATCWQAARDDLLRPAVVSSWSELNDVLREVPVNLLILAAKTWNVPSSCNTARRFFQHLQNRS